MSDGIGLKARLAHWKEIGSWGWGVVAALYGILAAATLTRDSFMSPIQRAKYDLFDFLPHWSLWQWLLGAALLALMAVLEGSFRVHRERESEHDTVVAALDGERREIDYPEEEKRATLQMRLREVRESAAATERDAREALRQRDEELARLRPRASMRERQDQAARLVREARELLNDYPANANIFSASTGWRERVTTWCDDTYSFLEESFSPATAERFADESGLWDGVDAIRYSYAGREYRVLERRMTNLSAILDQSDKYLA